MHFSSFVTEGRPRGGHRKIGGLASSCRLAGWLLLLAGSLGATLVPRMSLEEIVDASESIVQGTVVRTWSAWDANQRHIWTHYEIQIVDKLKGSGTGTLIVSEPGGTVGETALQIVGTPQYQVGEEVVLFAERTPLGYLRTCGWGQGKFRLERAATGGKVTVRAAARGIQLVERPSSDQLRVERGTPVGRVDGLELEEFKTHVRQVIADRQRATRQ